MGEHHHQEKAKVGGKLEWLQANQIGIIFDDDRELLEECWHNGVWVYAVHPNPKRSSSPVYRNVLQAALLVEQVVNP